LITRFSNIEKPVLDDRHIDRRKIVFSVIVAFVIVFALTILHTIQYLKNEYWYNFGIYPRQIYGLKGILFAPLLHSNFSHLFSNALPLFVLFSSAIYFFRIKAFNAIIWIWIVTGWGVWLFGRESYHIGASGVVYGLAAFLGFSGILKNDIRLISLTFLIVFLYGGMVWGIFPVEPAISWESHLIGGLTGLLLAFRYRKFGPKTVPYFADEAQNTLPRECYLKHDPLNGKLIRFSRSNQ
jgi:membrane associated rhomboid family serine protease